jgi:nitroreductase
VRSYLPKPPPDGALETMVAAAQSSSTSSNLQTWSVVAVTDPEAKRKLAAVAANQRHVMECPLLLVWLADISRNQRLGDAAGVTMEVMPYLETFFVACIDAAFAAAISLRTARLAWTSPICAVRIRGRAVCGHRAPLGNYASTRSADPAVGTPPILVGLKL